MGKGSSGLYKNTHGEKLRAMYASNEYGDRTDAQIISSADEELASSFNDIKQTPKVIALKKETIDLFKRYMSNKQAIAAADLLFGVTGAIDSSTKSFAVKAAEKLGIIESQFTVAQKALKLLGNYSYYKFLGDYRNLYFDYYSNYCLEDEDSPPCFEALENLNNLHEAIVGTKLRYNRDKY